MSIRRIMLIVAGALLVLWLIICLAIQLRYGTTVFDLNYLKPWALPAVPIAIMAGFIGSAFKFLSFEDQPDQIQVGNTILLIGEIAVVYFIGCFVIGSILALIGANPIG